MIQVAPAPAQATEPKKSGPRVSDESAYEDAETESNVTLFISEFIAHSLC